MPAQSFAQQQQRFNKTLLRFELPQMYVYRGHSLAMHRFELAFTSAARDYFADGLANMGNVNESVGWHRLTPIALQSEYSTTHLHAMCGKHEMKAFLTSIINLFCCRSIDFSFSNRFLLLFAYL
jgi:hypothetical protein